MSFFRLVLRGVVALRLATTVRLFFMMTPLSGPYPLFWTRSMMKKLLVCMDTKEDQLSITISVAATTTLDEEQ
jgi:hypothetical protein